jgi:hypothetical protein
MATPNCEPADWAPRKLGRLLVPGTKAQKDEASSVKLGVGRIRSDLLGQDSPCDDYPGTRAPYPGGLRGVFDGVELTLLRAAPAGKSGRNWQGNQCSYEVGLADGGGRTLTLDERIIPPFTSVYSLLRHGSRAFVAVQFNGYAREFPHGGCFVMALDLCAGKVMWRSPNYSVNGDLALVANDYLVAGYGFTAEKRILQVYDAHSGAILQSLRLPGNPEELKFERGVLTVETNHGPAMFALVH